MSASFTVFVCSTFDDLEQEREAVLDAIRRVQQRHNAMEFFGARPGQPIDVCLDEVRKSDLLVVIVGLKYGSLPPGMGISYSQAEYEEGRGSKKTASSICAMPTFPSCRNMSSRTRTSLGCWTRGSRR
jgi:hypothetical protein